jgi:hypothetical protein
MHLSLSWSWIVGVIAALIVIASLFGSRRRRGALEPPGEQLDDSGTFPVLMPPEEPAEILVPPEEAGTGEVASEVIPEAAAEIPPEAPVAAIPPEDELDGALDDALDRVVK